MRILIGLFALVLVIITTVLTLGTDIRQKMTTGLAAMTAMLAHPTTLLAAATKGLGIHVIWTPVAAILAAIATYATTLITAINITGDTKTTLPASPHGEDTFDVLQRVTGDGDGEDTGHHFDQQAATAGADTPS